MRHLANWSRGRIQVLWLAWFGLLVGFVVLDVWRQWQRQKLEAPPEQHTDLVYSVVADDVDLFKTVLIIIGPPGLLTAIWLYARHRWQPKPST
jgi:hypothetical protein